MSYEDRLCSKIRLGLTALRSIIFNDWKGQRRNSSNNVFCKNAPSRFADAWHSIRLVLFAITNEFATPYPFLDWWPLRLLYLFLQSKFIILFVALNSWYSNLELESQILFRLAFMCGIRIIHYTFYYIIYKIILK